MENVEDVEDVEDEEDMEDVEDVEDEEDKRMYVYEDSNFNLCRHRQQKKVIYSIRAIVKDLEIDHDPTVTFLFRKLPDIYVRVPVLMAVSIPNLEKKEEWEENVDQATLRKDFFELFNHLIRRQAGSHLFVSLQENGGLKNILVEWNGITRTDVERAQGMAQGSKQRLVGADRWSRDPVHCAYPCFFPERLFQRLKLDELLKLKKQGKKSPEIPRCQLLLGVAFPNRMTNNVFRRSYCRFEHEMVNNCCQDIKVEFIASPPTERLNCKNFYKNKANADPNHHRIAFYVCRGARLVVQDTRIEGGEYGFGKKGKAHRCLYQQGSLVVIYGNIQYSICVKYSDKSRNWSSLANNILTCSDEEHPAQRVTDSFERKWDQGVAATIDQLRDKVIFLGPIESQFHSLCWFLKITNSVEIPRECRGLLDMPDGGVIQDVAPWETGFELIRWRHRYERSWENITQLEKPKSHFTDPFRFEKPSEDYFLRRILGLQHNPMIVDYPRQELDLPEEAPEEGDNEFQNYHRFNEYLIKWSKTHWSFQIPPPPPPLYPPAKYNDQFWYPEINGRVVWRGLCDHLGDEKELLSIEGSQDPGNMDKLYCIDHAINVEGWQWKKYTENDWNRVDGFRRRGQHNFERDIGFWMRESIDRVKYIKFVPNMQCAVSSYKMDMRYLEPHICPDHPQPPTGP